MDPFGPFSLKLQRVTFERLESQTPLSSPATIYHSEILSYVSTLEITDTVISQQTYFRFRDVIFIRSTKEDLQNLRQDCYPSTTRCVATIAY